MAGPREALKDAARSLLVAPTAAKTERSEPMDAGALHVQASISPQDRLLSLLRDINHLNDLAQGSMKEIPPKTELGSDLVVEWQRTWYTVQDMMLAGKNRAAFRRPSGWSAPDKRRQVLDGIPLERQR